ASRWVLSRVSVFDGHPGDGVDTRLTTFRYSGGFYSRLEREFYGYGEVVEEERDASNGEALYRSTVRDYLNDSLYSHGLLSREVVLDGAGNPYLQTVHTYAFRDVATNAVPADVTSTTATIAPQRVRKDEYFYE